MDDQVPLSHLLRLAYSFRLTYLFLNIYDTYQVLKYPPPSTSNGGQPSIRAMAKRKRKMKGVVTVWMVWCCIVTYEMAIEPPAVHLPHYHETKIVVFFFLTLTRAHSTEPLYFRAIRPLIKPHTQNLDALLEKPFWNLFVVLVYWPTQAFCKGLTFNFLRYSSVAKEHLQSVGSDESSPKSRLKQRPQAHALQRSITSNTFTSPVSVDGSGIHHAPASDEEEDHSHIWAPPLPVSAPAPGPYPGTRSSGGLEDIPTAYPQSPVLVGTATICRLCMLFVLVWSSLGLPQQYLPKLQYDLLPGRTDFGIPHY